MKKHVTINNKENTANILLLNIFLYTKSDFIVFDFTMKSLPIIVFYFRWRMLEDSLSFQLSSLAPLNGKKINLDPPTKRAISKMSINDVISVNFYIAHICKTKIAVAFIYSSFTLIFTLIFHFHHLHFKNKI